MHKIPLISVYSAHPRSGLSRLAGADGKAPYWAFAWPGGKALARYLLDHPALLAGRRVLDLGSGSGLVAIAAALAGAAEVSASDIDPYALAAIGLNAEANHVMVATVPGDLTLGPAPDVDVVLVGDLFYDATIAARVVAFLDRCVAAGITVLVGDPGRAFLPLSRLDRLAGYAVGDVGEDKGATESTAAVFAFRPA